MFDGPASRSSGPIRRAWCRALGFGLAIAALAPAAAGAVPLHSTPGPPIQDLDIGSDGDVFAIAVDTTAGADGTLLQWIYGEWVPFGTRRGIRVAVDSRGRPWLINQAQQVWRFDGSAWVQIPGTTARAIDIGRTPTGPDRIFIIRPSYLIASWNGSSFVNFSGSGTEITVDATGNPWIVNSLGELWQYRSSGGWRHFVGWTGRDIDAGADGTVYMLQGGGGANGTIYRFNYGTDTWDHNGGYGVRIAVEATGAPAITNSAHSVWGNFVKRIHGDVTCVPGESDCNVCAFDVRGQFASMFTFGHRTNTGDGWSLQWADSYGPSDRTPLDAFDYCCPVISDHHVQGFVRTGHPLFPFAGSYSDDTLGSVFLVSPFQTSAPRYGLTAISNSAAAENHPSGIHALGQHLGVAESNALRIYQLSNIYATSSSYELPFRDQAGPFGTRYFGTVGGGLGLSRLPSAQGVRRYLVAATNPGGNDGSPPRQTFFWELLGTSPTAILLSGMALLGGDVHQLPSSWGWDYYENENLSLITECETGQIYGVHTSGDWSLHGSGFWRVSRLEQGPNGPRFRALDRYSEGQNEGDCHIRSAATAYADAAGVITTYCHQRDVRRWESETSDVADFRVRTGIYASSCLASCGEGTAQPGGCWCDPYCVTAGDCCNDYLVHCSTAAN